MRMAPGDMEKSGLKVDAGQNTAVAHNGNIATDKAVAYDVEKEDAVVVHAIAAIGEYLMNNAPIYQQLQQLRAKVRPLQETLRVLACR